MTQTVIAPAPPAEAFDDAYRREVLLSERLRVSIVLVLISSIVLRWVVLWLFVPDAISLQVGDTVHVGVLLGFGAATLLYELIVLVRLTRAIRNGTRIPKALRYLNALIEVSLPTIAILMRVEEASPANALLMPPAWAYFIFIILAVLRLDFWLCLFTAGAAAAQYGLVGVYLLNQPQTGLADPLLTTMLNHGLRVGMLLGAGVAAGVAAMQLQRQFTRSLRSVEEQNRILGMFGQHVSPAVVERLLSQDVEIDGEVRHVCVMFLDIQGFTTFSESRRPEEVVTYLNTLFSGMIDSVNRHDGIVNKFLGDGFMAVFGAPITDARDCHNAVTASLEIIKHVEALVAGSVIAPTTIRIGLHAGEAVTGNVGSTARKEYTIIGDVVNLASRLEQLNKQFGSTLLVSETVTERIDGLDVQRIPHGTVQVRGREYPVKVYELA